jgi:3-oxoadipate enol-lactonase
MAAHLHHELTGPEDAPVVVLGSSLGTTHSMWASQVEALSQRFRVLAFDHRGHGGSEVPPGPYSMDDLGGDVLALLDELGIGRSSYAGISLGGMVGLWLAQNAPDRFHRFVLLCASALHSGGQQMWTDRAAQVRAEGTKAVADTTLGRWFLPAYAEANPERVAEVKQELLDNPAEGYAGCCEAVGSMDLRAGLADITAPVLLIAADTDQSVPAQDVLAVANAIPGSRFEVIEDAAHLVTVSHPDQVNQLLLDHLAD